MSYPIQLSDVATALASIPISLYGVVIASYLGLKFVGALTYEPVDGGEYAPTVSVIVPEYNEDPELMEQCLDSVLEQTYDVAEVFVTDDGSDDARAWEVVQSYAAEYDCIDAARFDENRGKRRAQARGFEAATGEVYVTVDSDTVLEPDAVERIVEPFDDPDVTAVTGYPEVINRDENLLTQLIHMRYWSAFNVDRAARSVLGYVYCCCGVFSAYRASVVDDALDDYVDQTFFGQECSFGDDRRMTRYALAEGKVLYQQTARASTDAPTTVRKYVKQQVRWMRSFWRESFLAARWAPRRSPALAGVILAEMSLPVALLTFGLGAAVHRTILLGAVVNIVAYVGAICAMAYVRNVLFSNVDLKTYLMSPLYGLMYFAMLLPMTFYALVTMRANHWGTR